MHGWRHLTDLPQWSTSNWRSSQRWPSPRAAARASTPLSSSLPPPPPPPQLISEAPAPPSAVDRQRPSFFKCSFVFTPQPLPSFDSATLQSNLVDVHYCNETDYLEKTYPFQTRNMFSNLLDSHQLHGIIYDSRLTLLTTHELAHGSGS